jgi:hypothetical protein
MKKILCLLPFIAVSAFGQPEVLAPIVCSGVSTSTTPVTAVSPVVSAYVNALKIVVSDSKTCTVSVATADLTVYTATDVTGTVVVYPVVEASTNGVAAGVFSKACLASDKLTVSAHTITDSGTASVTVTPIIERQP